ncbi:Citrate transporter [anaerobic digester metagenome]
MIPLSTEQAIVFGTLILALVLFIHGGLRYDLVSLLALFIVTVTGLVPWDQAFIGFANPAVITVAAVLVISQGLSNAGLIDAIARVVERVGARPSVHIASTTALVTALSAVMNNVGALALLMPVSRRMARADGNSPAPYLLSLAFGSLLGGLITLIGTPPNLIIATYRAEATGAPFTMFDFTPVGLGVALAGLVFISVVGWRLVPSRRGKASRKDLFRVTDYLAEVRIPRGSWVVGRTLQEVEEMSDVDVTLVWVLQEGARLPISDRLAVLQPGDLLAVRTCAVDLGLFLVESGLDVAACPIGRTGHPLAGEPVLMEATVQRGSPSIGKTFREVAAGSEPEVHLIAVAAEDRASNERLKEIPLQAGDILLLRGTPSVLHEVLKPLGLLPLAERGLKIGEPRRVALAIGTFGIAILLAALAVIPVQVIFPMAAVAMVIMKLIPLREIYTSIDWPIIVLLGALIPVGHALETTGGAQLIANSLLGLEGYLPVTAILVLILVATMLLSNVINNAATAVLMAPIALSLAGGLGVSVDSFLMAIVVGASTPFLTPIGHQSNAMVMEPAGLRFGDYWRLGLPLSLIIIAVAVPLILIVWPL